MVFLPSIFGGPRYAITALLRIESSVAPSCGTIDRNLHAELSSVCFCAHQTLAPALLRYLYKQPLSGDDHDERSRISVSPKAMLNISQRGVTSHRLRQLILREWYGTCTQLGS